MPNIRFYIYGGCADTNFGNVPFDDLWSLNIETMEWHCHTLYD